jgi:C_GCAxxG_C_C family probable redox protein
MKTDTAVEKFLSGFNCAQAVLHTYSNDFHFDPETALKIACGLGAGLGRKEEVCGAVTGGVLVIGLKYGRGGSDDRTATERTYKKTRELMALFRQEQGTYICRELIDNCDLMTEEGQKYFKEQDLQNKTCKHCVRSVVRILEEIL